MNEGILISKPMRDAGTLTRPAFPVPPGSCDAHVHVFEPEDRYPHVARPQYTLPFGNLRQLQAATGALGIERFAIVQPTFYGTDNRCMLDALDAAGACARGVAMVKDDLDESGLREMHRRGVRAMRLDLFARRDLPTRELSAYISRCVDRTRALGWHLQFYTPGWVVRDLIPYLGDVQADFVIDHMGYMLESDGLTRADFDRLLRAVADGRGWFKLSGFYRVAKDGNYAKLRPLARAIVETVPDRVVWGSDWPHIPDGGRDTGELLDLLGHWVPEDDLRRRILADNPARLYGF